ncbi:hypothetical protein TNCV_2067561 [Trichonephila clavipes]|uniref:Uncharacterized protein n=1 Tax=Trichonephila clavipes TaxID=2585209 RepID=A0A8X7BCZ6_TRICX|nr:hypothetical protein TNCV_2067561 [Trichonephila clavipes]
MRLGIRQNDGAELWSGFSRKFKARSRGGKAASINPDPAREVQPIPSQDQRRNHQESRFPIFRKNSAGPGGTSPVQKRPIQKRETRACTTPDKVARSLRRV